MNSNLAVKRKIHLYDLRKKRAHNRFNNTTSHHTASTGPLVLFSPNLPSFSSLICYYSLFQCQRFLCQKDSKTVVRSQNANKEKHGKIIELENVEISRKTEKLHKNHCLFFVESCKRSQVNLWSAILVESKVRKKPLTLRKQYKLLPKSMQYIYFWI